MSDLCGMAVLAVVPEPGQYVSTFKIVLALVVLLPWLYASTWMSKDTVRVHTVRLLWCGLTLGAGVAGLAIWMLVPYFVLGAAVYLVLVGGAVGAYVLHRNKRVVPEARVLTAEHLRSVWAGRKSQVVEVVQHLKLYDGFGKPVFAPPEEAPDERRAYNAAQQLLRGVVMLRASEVDLSPTGPQTAVRFVVDGVVQNRPPLDRQEADLLINFVKRIGGMNVEDRRRPQNGKISLDMGALRIDLNVAAAGTTHGQRLQFRVLQESVQTRLGELGMPDSLLTRLVEINVGDNGLIIVSGPKGNGVTSTLYSLMRKHDAFMKQLAALETSVAADLENVTQQNYTDQAQLAGLLASVLRRDADVVMVDRCDTPEAARVIHGAAAGKKILLGCAADNVFVALAKWIKVCGDRNVALERLQAVICQKLLRKLCPNCKEGYTPAREMLAKLNLPADKIESFYRPPTKPLTDEKGKPITCPTCQGTGYFGRTAAFEMLEVTDEIRDLILQNAPLSRIKAACRRNGMLYLQEQGLRKVMEGVTSVEEVIRVSKIK